MVKVRFFELESSKDLQETEKRINHQLGKAHKAAPTVKLFRAGDELVYSVLGLPVSGGKRMMDALDRVVREELGFQRGRPAGEPTHQVKVRVRESRYRILLKKARKQGVSASHLAGKIVEESIA